MADSIQGIKISELPEAAQSQLTDTSVAVVDDGTTTRKTKLSTFVSWLKSKLNISTMQEDINNLNTKISEWIKMESQGIEVSIGANTTVNGKLNIEVSGYRAFGIVGIAPNVFGVIPERSDVGQVDGKDVVFYRFRNVTKSTVTVTLWFRVMYLKE